MHYIKRLVLVVVCLGVLTGCENKSEKNLAGQMNNIDISKIEKNIEIPEKLFEMHSQSQGTWDDNKIYTVFPKLVKSYGGLSDDTDNMFIETWIEGEQQLVPLKKLDKEEIWNVKYCTPSLYLEMDDIMQVMTYNPEEVSKITGMDLNINRLWIPNDSGEPIKSFVIGVDDIEGVSYCLNGEQVSLKDSIVFVEKQFTDNNQLPNVSKHGFEYHVSKVDVFQFGDNYCYYFTMQVLYDGIKLDDTCGDSDEKNSAGKNMRFIQTIDRCSMFSKDKINGIYIFDWLNNNQDSIEEIEPKIDYKKALEKLSEHLSQDHTFDVIDAGLVYSFYVETEDNQEVTDGINRIVPYWQFELSVEGMQQYNNIYILIDVQTGEVIEKYA